MKQLKKPQQGILYCCVMLSLAAGPYSDTSWSIADYVHHLWQQWWTSSPQTLPLDEQVHCGQLDNGFSYYIRPHEGCGDQVELRLVVRVGSVHEQEHERGLAHFLEHLIFRGTEQYSHEALAAWMQALGMEWGPDVNAQSSYDYTSFHLCLAKDRLDSLPEALFILSEFAGYAKIDDAAVDFEREVVLNEIYSRDGLEQQSERRWHEAIFRHSRYEQRHPSGLASVIAYSQPALLRKFYERWYRPELMAVFVVGEVDHQLVEDAISQSFGRLRKSINPLRSPAFPIPSQSEAQVLIDSDTHIAEAEIRIGFKHPVSPQRLQGRDLNFSRTMSAKELYTFLIDRLFHDMLQYRFLELQEEGEAGFFSAESQLQHPVRSLDLYHVSAKTTTELLCSDLEILVSELRRISVHGFTEPELERARSRQRRRLERELSAADQQGCGQLMERCVGHFLFGKPLVDLQSALEEALCTLDGIQVEEVTQWLSYLYASPENCVIWARVPARDRLDMPTKRMLRKAYMLGRFIDVEPYHESPALLQNLLPRPNSLSDCKRQELDHQLTEWKLDNGLRVLFKPCADGAVTVRAVAQGGISSLPPEKWAAARLASSLGREWKMEGLSNCELQRLFPGTATALETQIFPSTRQLRIHTEAEAIEEAFQLLHLAFTNTRCEEQAQSPSLRRCRDTIRDYGRGVPLNFDELTRVINTQDHPFFHPMSTEAFAQLDLDWIKKFRRHCFRDPSEFTIIVTGPANVEHIDRLSRKYLGSIPPSETAQLNSPSFSCHFPSGVQRAQVLEGASERSRVRLCFPIQRIRNPRELCAVKAAGWILHHRLNKLLREEQGLTYKVNLSWHSPLFPSFQSSYHALDFACRPEDVDHCVAIILQEVSRLQQQGPHPHDMAMLKVNSAKTQAEEDRSPQFWSRLLTSAVLLDWDPAELLSEREQLDAIDPLQLRLALQQHFRDKQFTLLRTEAR